MAFLFTAQLVHGQPHMADYFNSTNATIPAGTIIVDGATLRIVHNDIPSQQLGAVAIGGGTYLVPKASDGLTVDGGGSANVTTAIADGTDVYWNATAQQVATTSNSGANLKLGVTEAASLDTDTHQLVFHETN